MNKIKLFILMLIYACQYTSTIAIITTYSLFSRRKKKVMTFSMPTSQSQLLNMQSGFSVPPNLMGSQTKKLDEKLNRNVRVAFTDDKAYWIYDNSFYSAVLVDGEVDAQSAQIVDMFSASDNELSKYLHIIDGLKG
jgi:hypothetical protein